MSASTEQLSVMAQQLMEMTSRFTLDHDGKPRALSVSEVVETAGTTLTEATGEGAAWKPA